ncbi:MAG: phosphoribosylamine--glycine ligase [Candidatus Levybacteria bacterium]|nr:phosphoribosylamine--glycine ligase [Candidatus Levybacteria bacterium]
MKKKGNTVLVIDGGGRGAVLVHKYSQSPHVSKIIVIPGNDLMKINSQKPVKIFPNLKTTSLKEILKISKKEKVDLADVAQDNAVETGLVDKLTKEKFNVVGPTHAAGQIEWDKAWAREFMKKYKIPSPDYHIFNSQKKAINFINKNPSKRFFIKASGLAEGKGAIPAENAKEAIKAIKQMDRFGKSGETFVIEEWLVGEEFSMFAITDGSTFQILGCAEDYKRLYDRDLGPNTGGIGCITPTSVVNKKIYKQGELIFKKTVLGLASEKRPYKGVLYLGGMVVEGKVFVIEFNARWGDPEAEVLVPGIENDFFELSMNVAQGNLRNFKIIVDGKSRVAVTGSLRPGAINKKRELFGIEKALRLKGITLYGARVTKDKDKYFVSSGRLFHVVGEGKAVIEARKRAYDAMFLLSIEGNNLHFRTDIGWRDVKRLRK